MHSSTSEEGCKKQILTTGKMGESTIESSNGGNCVRLKTVALLNGSVLSLIGRFEAFGLEMVLLRIFKMPLGVGSFAPAHKRISFEMLAHKNNDVVGFEAKLGFDHFEGGAIFQSHFNNARNVFCKNLSEPVFSREGT